MGVNALTTRIVLQDLLQKQYEGLSFVVLGNCSKMPARSSNLRIYCESL